MKHYVLALDLSIRELPEDVPDESPGPPAEMESPDPVARDRDEINPVSMIRAMKKELDGFGPFQRPKMPPPLSTEKAATHNSYDVSAENLEAAVRIIEQFRALAERLGVARIERDLAATPFFITPPPYIPGG